jgi:N6-L-threonylcarbamoyladenine synthase
VSLIGKEMLKILGIETSCDESSVAIVNEDKEILFLKTMSQTASHLKYGGVVPEVASRAHLENLDKILDELIGSGFDLNELDAIAVTSCPGLIGALIVGVMYGKALAASLKKPLLAINHLAGHAVTIRMTNEIEYPFLTLLISGGNTQFLIVKDVDQYIKLGETRDDALGEAFDKTARILGLGYPGGPKIEKRARQGDENAYDFPKPMWDSKDCNLSFSGLKSDITRRINAIKEIEDKDINNIAASFQRTITDLLKKKLSIALDLFEFHLKQRAKTFVLTGGVSANKYICGKLESFCNEKNVKFLSPPKELCGDNAAMIAWTGLERYKKGLLDSLDFPPKPKAELGD